jgi:hypothetical protein
MITPENITEFGLTHFKTVRAGDYVWHTYELNDLQVRFGYYGSELKESEILIDNHDPQRLTATVLVQLINIFKTE